MGDVVVAIDGGTESVRVALLSASSGEVLHSRAEKYPTQTPANGWAEQRPADWWASLCAACTACVAEADIPAERIVGLSFVTTTCTLLALGADGEPLGDALLWSDVRSSAQAERIHATRHPAVTRVSAGGFSAEWMLAKTLWLAEERPELYAQAEHIVEYGDWLLRKLCGVLALSGNTATQRWLYDNSDTEAGRWPTDLFATLGLESLESKLPPVMQVGDEASAGLTPDAARALGLPQGCRVFVGGGDAFVGLLGMGVSSAGEFGLMTGSSNVLSGFTATLSAQGEGLFGAFPNAVVPGAALLEAGQPATGSMLCVRSDSAPRP